MVLQQKKGFSVAQKNGPGATQKKGFRVIIAFTFPLLLWQTPVSNHHGLVRQKKGGEQCVCIPPWHLLLFTNTCDAIPKGCWTKEGVQ